jgi:hypothetical protein
MTRIQSRRRTPTSTYLAFALLIAATDVARSLTIVPAKRHKSSASQGLDSDRYVSGDKRHQTSPAQSAKRDVSSSPERPAGWAMTKSPAGRKRRQSKKPVPAAKDVEYE